MIFQLNYNIYNKIIKNVLCVVMKFFYIGKFHRQNCLPGTTYKDEALCTSKGCLWDSNMEVNEPQCYYPEDFKTFTIDGDVTTDAQGWFVPLKP